MSKGKLVGYVITDSNVSPCGTKLSYGAKDRYQLWEAYSIPKLNRYGEDIGEKTLEFYCIETNIEEKEYGNQYKDLPLLRSWGCNVYRELL
jgi:hypothetical protein